MAKVLIIIPAYNEAENIVRVVDRLIREFPQYDYVVINDGSRDDTAAVCRALLALARICWCRDMALGVWRRCWDFAKTPLRKMFRR